MSSPVQNSFSFSTQQLLLQVTHLKNIEFAVGFAVYTGLCPRGLLVHLLEVVCCGWTPVREWFSSVALFLFFLGVVYSLPVGAGNTVGTIR